VAGHLLRLVSAETGSANVLAPARRRRGIDRVILDNDAIVGGGGLFGDVSVCYVRKDSFGIALNRIAVASPALERVAEHIARTQRNVAGLRPELLDTDGDHLVEIGGKCGDRCAVAGTAANEIQAARAWQTAKLPNRIRHL